MRSVSRGRGPTVPVWPVSGRGGRAGDRGQPARPEDTPASGQVRSDRRDRSCPSGPGRHRHRDVEDPDRPGRGSPDAAGGSRWCGQGAGRRAQPAARADCLGGGGAACPPGRSDPDSFGVALCRLPVSTRSSSILRSKRPRRPYAPSRAGSSCWTKNCHRRSQDPRPLTRSLRLSSCPESVLRLPHSWWSVPGTTPSGSAARLLWRTCAGPPRCLPVPAASTDTGST